MIRRHVHVEDVFRLYASTNSSVDTRGSLRVGPPGPLVRFDQSHSLLFLWPNRGGGSGDLRRRLAAPRGHPSAAMDPLLLGGPSGGRGVAEGGGSHRRRVPRRRGASVTK